MMTKIVYFTDFHAHIFTEFSKTDDEYVTDRFREQMDILQKVFDIARREEAELVFGGDLFHKRGTIDVRVYNHVQRVFRKNTDIPTVLLRGNHDSTTNSLYTESSLEGFEIFPNVEVISTPKVLERDGYNLYGLPYGDEVVEMKQWLNEQELDNSKPNVLVAHIGVDGAVTGKQSHRLEGAFTVADLRTQPWDMVLLGHYHRRQFLGGKGDILYGGNTIQNTFSDEGQGKGVFLIEVEKGKRVEADFIEIKSRPFITVTGNNVPDNMDKLLAESFVRFVGTADEAQAVRDIMTESEATTVRIQVEKDYKTEARLSIDNTSSPEEIVKAYMSKFYPEATEVALDCLKEAQIR